MILWQVTSNGFPALASVLAHQEIGFEIAVFVIIKRYVNRVGVVKISSNVINERGIGNAG